MPTGMPSEYHIRLIFSTSTAKRSWISGSEVNDPLTFHGITFYQSSYSGSGRPWEGRFEHPQEKRQSDGRGDGCRGPGASLFIPSIDRTIKVLGFEPFGMRNPSTGQVQYYIDRQEFINPAVEIEVYKGQKALYRTTILKTDSGEPSMPEDYVISYRGYVGARYTGLQVTKDPGVWVVYTGFIMLCIGPPIAFFGSHRKLWVRIQNRNGQAIILVAGTANRNRIGFEREFNRIAENISS